MHGCAESASALEKILGQVAAIDKMVDEDVPCEDILMQINAAKSALHKVGQIVLEGHLGHCVREGIEHGDAERPSTTLPKPWIISAAWADIPIPVSP